MDFRDININEEREKLFDEVWQEPMTTVAKRYELSDNGLRKRCKKLQIPLPPAGHWAKLQAGKEVTPKPKLPKLKVTKIYEEDSKHYQSMELIDIENQSNEQLKELDGMELLTPESKESFLKWCSKIQVPKRIEGYNPLIIDCQNEIAYRKARDEEHKFRDIFKYHMFMQYKIEYRNNKAVLPISVSDKQANRAYRIIDTLIKSVNELDGKIVVESSESDNATFRLFEHAFSFQMTEIMVKRRSLLSGSPSENAAMSFRPIYEKVFSGLIEIEFKEILNYWEKDKAPKTLKFVDSIDSQIENQFGEIFIALYKLANEAKIAKIIAEREYRIKEREQKRLREIEEEERRMLQLKEEQDYRKKNLVQNIERQMEGWFKSQKLRKYVEEIETYASAINDETTKELLSAYINLVRQKAEKYDPVADILNEVKAIGIEGLTELI
ncbi:MAG: hypothetical protein ACM3UU_11300 [Ignavibacteriales bacterium]